MGTGREVSPQIQKKEPMPQLFGSRSQQPALADQLSVCWVEGGVRWTEGEGRAAAWKSPGGTLAVPRVRLVWPTLPCVQLLPLQPDQTKSREAEEHH